MTHASGSESEATALELSVEQREAIGTWRWLGWRNSTPAFKASLALLGAVAFALAAYWVVVIGA